MRKILLALALLLSPTVADAACNGVFNAATICGNLGSVPAPPQAWPTSGSTFGPVGGSTSGDIVTWQGSSGQQLGDSGVSFGTSQNTVPLNNGNNYFSGIVSQFFTNITSVFEYHGNVITFPTSLTTVPCLACNQAWTGINSFSQVGITTLNVSSFTTTTPVGVPSGGTGVATIPAHNIVIGEGTSPTSSVGPGTAGQFPTFNGPSADPTAVAGPWTLLATLTPTTSGFIDTTHLTSAYNDYEFVFENTLPAVTSNTCEILVQINGGFQTSGYLGQTLYANATSPGGNATTTFIPCSVVGDAVNTGPGIGGSIILHQPSSTTVNKIWTGLFNSSFSSGIITYSVGGYYNGGTQAVTGVQITLATSIFTSGQVKLYGRL